MFIYRDNKTTDHHIDKEGLNRLKQNLGVIWDGFSSILRKLGENCSKEIQPAINRVKQDLNTVEYQRCQLVLDLLSADKSDIKR